MILTIISTIKVEIFVIINEHVIMVINTFLLVQSPTDLLTYKQMMFGMTSNYNSPTTCEVCIHVPFKMTRNYIEVTCHIGEGIKLQKTNTVTGVT